MSDTLQQKLEYFNAKKATILEANQKFQEAKTALDARVQEFIDANKGPVNELGAALDKLTQEYRAECKAAFGIADGESLNVLEVIEAMAKVKYWA